MSQLYAVDEKGEAVHAAAALRGNGYFCLECGKTVGLRKGNRRRAHYYHAAAAQACRQQGKGLAHLAVQERITRLLGPAVTVERRFPQIGRVADVAWEEEKIIFEVQYSPISPEELQARNRDYASIGYSVVWLLHDRRYNKRTLTAVEKSIRANAVSHYFTNIDSLGRGIIYDQESWVAEERRICRSGRAEVDLSHHFRSPKGVLPSFLKRRRHCFSGDLLWRWGAEGDADPLIASFTSAGRQRRWKSWIQGLLLRPLRCYRALLRTLLESACRR